MSIKNSTIKLIATEAMKDLKINMPIDENKIIDIFEYFEEIEIYLSQNITEGTEVDTEYLEIICNAVNDLNDINNEDLKSLNIKIESFL